MRFQLFGLFFCVLALHGQTPLGTVSGLAVDASGGAVAAASVTLTNNDTGVRRTAATNASARLRLPGPPARHLSTGSRRQGLPPNRNPRLRRRGLPHRPPGLQVRDLPPPPKSSSRKPHPPSCSSVPRGGQQPGAPPIIETPTTSAASPEFRRFRPYLEHPAVDRTQRRSGGQWRRVADTGAGATSVKVKVDGIETTFGNFGSPDNVSQPFGRGHSGIHRQPSHDARRVWRHGHDHHRH